MVINIRARNTPKYPVSMALNIKKIANSIHFFLLFDMKKEKPNHVFGLNLSNICMKRVIIGGAEYTSANALPILYFQTRNKYITFKIIVIFSMILPDSGI